MGCHWYGVVVDAADPARLARWWAEVLDYRVRAEEDGEVMIGREGESRPVLTFIRVPESKAGKNRLHIDLTPEDRDAEVERLVNMGARHVDVGQGEVSWVVLADPEGNEFCLLRAKAPA